MDINESRNRRKKQTGEYFTPEWQVRKMIDKIPEEFWKDPSKTVLEPSCGNGNFVVQVIQKKVECGSTVEQAIKTTYAIDLMEDNVIETRKRVKGIILELGGSKELFPIVDIHIKCADTLKVDMDELFPNSEHEALFNNQPVLMLDFGMEGGGEHIFLEPTKDGLRFRKEFSYMQLDIDDWKTGEEIIPSLKSYWEEFTNNPKWFRYHPRLVHKDCRSMVIQSLQQINLKEITPSESDSVDDWIEVLMEGKYESDTPYKNQCRFHQSQYRSKVLGVWFEEDINILKIEDGKAGLNFYDSFGIRKLVKKIPFRKPFHSNLLRSEHLPYNLFVPLNQDKEFCKQVLNDLLASTFIERIIHDIVIEYAPQPKENYLDDHTSFDVYIEYQHSDGSHVLNDFGSVKSLNNILKMS